MQKIEGGAAAEIEKSRSRFLVLDPKRSFTAKAKTRQKKRAIKSIAGKFFSLIGRYGPPLAAAKSYRPHHERIQPRNSDVINSANSNR